MEFHHFQANRGAQISYFATTLWYHEVVQLQCTKYFHLWIVSNLQMSRFPICKLAMSTLNNLECFQGITWTPAAYKESIGTLGDYSTKNKHHWLMCSLAEDHLKYDPQSQAICVELYNSKAYYLQVHKKHLRTMCNHNSTVRQLSDNSSVC